MSTLYVLYKKALSTESRFAQTIADHARNQVDIVSPSKLQQHLTTMLLDQTLLGNRENALKPSGHLPLKKLPLQKLFDKECNW